MGGYAVKYVRLIARPDTWYKAGTEVFWERAVEDAPRDIAAKRRLTLFEWEEIKNPENAGIGCVGIRVVENPSAEGGGNVGDERWDGEWCAIDEFDVETVTEETP
jgi:hypothetical protein